MDDRIKHIIESGLLEMYLLGQTDTQQTEEIDALLEASPILKSAFEELEDLQFEMTETIATAPPPILKDTIKTAIRKESAQSTPAKVQKRNLSPWLPWAAAILLGVWAISSYISNKDLGQELAELKTEMNNHKIQSAELERQLEFANMELSFFNNPQTQRIELNGNRLSQNFEVIAYWNNELKKAKLATINLPDLPDNQVYQMWADVDGEMLDLGVLNPDLDMVNCKFLERAESLNITIEPEGGSEHPTVSRLVANAYLKA